MITALLFILFSCVLVPSLCWLSDWLTTPTPPELDPDYQEALRALDAEFPNAPVLPAPAAPASALLPPLPLLQGLKHVLPTGEAVTLRTFDPATKTAVTMDGRTLTWEQITSCKLVPDWDFQDRRSRGDTQ